jgi:protein ImuB
VRRIACLLAEAASAGMLASGGGAPVSRRPAARPTAPFPGQSSLLQVALAHSPRVEEGGPGLVYLDATGLRGLFGDEEQIARRLAGAAAERGLSVRVGIAGSRISALCACRWGSAIAIVAPGGEAAYLAPAPVALLGLAPEMEARLGRWGIRTLGQLAALPPAALFERLGSEGPRLQQLARGVDPRPLHPWDPPVAFEESADLDGPVDALGPLADLLAGLAERISDTLVRRGLSAEQFEWSCAMGDRTRHEGRFVPAIPLNDRRVIASLLRMWLEARPPRGVVESVTLRARPVRVPPTQASLTDPPRSARCIAETIVRLTALVGEEHIGVPVLLDSHRPDAVRLAPFVHGTARGDGPAKGRAALALRRLRPRLPAAITLVAGRPVEIRSTRLGGRIITSAGPWRASGEWWTDAPWLVDEWDVELGDGTLCRLVHDGSAWWLEGTYD